MTAFVILFATDSVTAQEPLGMPAPTKEHKWLAKFAGEWESEGEFLAGPQPFKFKTTGTTQPVGGFWITSNGKADLAGLSFSSVLTIGSRL